MGKHELTERIWSKRFSYGDAGKGDIDTIIRQYLSEKAKELHANNAQYGKARTVKDLDSIHTILGLDEVEERGGEGCGCHADFKDGEYSMFICPKHQPKSTLEKPHPASEGRKWCEHMRPGTVHYMHPGGGWFDEWRFCPKCGNPRPKELSLEERVAEAIRKAVDDNSTKSGDNFWLPQAQAAIKTVNEHYGNKVQ